MLEAFPPEVQVCVIKLLKFVKSHTDSRCFVVVGVGAFHSFMFMIEIINLWWIKTFSCYGGVCDGPFSMLLLSS